MLTSFINLAKALNQVNNNDSIEGPTVHGCYGNYEV